MALHDPLPLAESQPPQGAGVDVDAILSTFPPARRRYMRPTVSSFLASEPGRKASRHGQGFVRRRLEHHMRHDAGRCIAEGSGGSTIVLTCGRRDPILTEAVRRALPKSASSQRKYISRMLAFLSFEMAPGEDPRSFLWEDVQSVRIRAETWATKQLGLTINRRTTDFDSSVVIESADGPVDSRAIAFPAIRRMFTALKDLGVRAGPNPFDIDGWDLMTPLERQQYAIRKYGRVDHPMQHAGAQFRVAGREHYAPKPYDPRAGGVAMTEALASCPAVPEAVRQLVELMRYEGPRPVSVLGISFADWAESGFGQWTWAISKGSMQEAAIRLVLSPELVADVHRRIDAEYAADPRRPADTDEVRARLAAGADVRVSMALAYRLRAEGDVASLRRVALFASSRRRPFSYSGFNNHWLRPALKAAGTMVSTSIGMKRPTAVWLRRSMFTDRVEDALRTSTFEEELETKLDAIRSDVGHSSKSAIFRYSKPATDAFSLKGQMLRSKEGRDRLSGRAPIAVAAPLRLSAAARERHAGMPE